MEFRHFTDNKYDRFSRQQTIDYAGYQIHIADKYPKHKNSFPMHIVEIHNGADHVCQLWASLDKIEAGTHSKEWMLVHAKRLINLAIRHEVSIDRRSDIPAYNTWHFVYKAIRFAIIAEDAKYVGFFYGVEGVRGSSDDLVNARLFHVEDDNVDDAIDKFKVKVDLYHKFIKDMAAAN